MTDKTDDVSKCGLCGEPMPPGEGMFKYHGFSGDCPKPPLPRAVKPSYADLERQLSERDAELKECVELLEWSRKYVYYHQRSGDKKGMQVGSVPAVYPEDVARFDAILARLKESKTL